MKLAHASVALRAVLCGMLAVTVSACSGQQQDEENPEVTQDEEGSQNSGNNAEASENSSEEGNNESSSENGEEGSNENSGGEDGAEAPAEDSGADVPVDAPADTAATDAAAPAPAPDATAAAPAPAPAPAAAPAPAPAAAEAAAPSGPLRVVRWAKEGNTPVYNQAADGGQTVATLGKGDKVVCAENGGWGQVTDGMFVKLDQFSALAVPRDFPPATWIPPGQ